LKKIPIAYLWIYRRLLERKTNPLRTQLVLEVLRRNFYHMPRSIHYKILDDMEYYGLVQKINKQTYRLLYPKKKLPKIVNYDPLGLC